MGILGKKTWEDKGKSGQGVVVKGVGIKDKEETESPIH